MKPSSTVAALAVGVTLGVGAAIFGAPVWGALLLGSLGTFATKRAIDASA